MKQVTDNVKSNAFLEGILQSLKKHEEKEEEKKLIHPQIK